MSAYDNAHYHARSPESKARKVLLQRARAHAIRAALDERKSKLSCKQCGESDTVVLDYDHRDPATKQFNISDAVTRGYSLSRVLAEIQKCDVLCANCHRRRTYKQFRV